MVPWVMHPYLFGGLVLVLLAYIGILTHSFRNRPKGRKFLVPVVIYSVILACKLKLFSAVCCVLDYNQFTLYRHASDSN